MIFALVSCQFIVDSTCPSDMKLISGGHFVLGSDLDQSWEEPLFETSLTSFCMDIYEYPNQKGQKPMGNISYWDAQKRCEEQNKRLCSSAEWERACRGTQRRRYSYGDQYDRGKCNTPIIGGGPGKGRKAPIQPSGFYPECVSEEGVFDLNGSLSEWVSDSWKDFPEPFNNVPAVNPASWRTLRGGTMWNNTFYGQECSSRHGHLGTMAFMDDGFRCCREPL